MTAFSRRVPGVRVKAQRLFRCFFARLLSVSVSLSLRFRVIMSKQSAGCLYRERLRTVFFIFFNLKFSPPARPFVDLLLRVTRNVERAQAAVAGYCDYCQHRGGVFDRPVRDGYGSTCLRTIPLLQCRKTSFVGQHIDRSPRIPGNRPFR